MDSAQPSTFYRQRVHDFIELHDQVETSVNLLDSLESFLSTFQTDLSAVSGQISDLQQRSRGIESRLKARRKIEKPLCNLISDLAIPPQTVRTILDTNVGEAWLSAITEFEQRIETIKSRSRVKAARDLTDVAEGLRIVAATKLRLFFNALFRPLRNNVTTNMQIVQSSVLSKYKPLFTFLRRQAPDIALEIQRSYVSAARVYYETGFRRYIRSLGYVKARTLEKFDPISSLGGELSTVDEGRLHYAKIEGPAVILAYLADDKSYKEPLEAVVRSLLLVFMDNATTEYSFVTSFFDDPAALGNNVEGATFITSPFGLLSPTKGTFSDSRSNAGSEQNTPTTNRHNRTASPPPLPTPSISGQLAKGEQTNPDAIWKQVFDPVLEYCQTFIKSTLEPQPGVVPLLTMIRLTENVISEVQRRSCSPVESFVFLLRLEMWPVFQKLMSENVDGLKKLADGGAPASGYFGFAALSGKPTSTSDEIVNTISQKYITLFNSFVALTQQEEETMIFSNLLRMRQELHKLIIRHSSTKGNTAKQVMAQSAMYDQLLQGLTRNTMQMAHPKAQQEIAYWANLDEEAKRKVVSMSRTTDR